MLFGSNCSKECFCWAFLLYLLNIVCLGAAVLQKLVGFMGNEIIIMQPTSDKNNALRAEIGIILP